MQRDELARLIGAQDGAAEYVPVSFLLKSGLACFGHYNAAVNEGLSDLCVLLNVQLLDLSQQKSRAGVRDFCDFLEEVVARESENGDAEPDVPAKAEFGRPIPIAAVSCREIAVVYPVARIGTLVRRAKEQGRPTPALLDFSRSEILSLMRMKVW
jgi:hypothetical protein